MPLPSRLLLETRVLLTDVMQSAAMVEKKEERTKQLGGGKKREREKNSEDEDGGGDEGRTEIQKKTASPGAAPQKLMRADQKLAESLGLEGQPGEVLRILDLTFGTAEEREEIGQNDKRRERVGEWDARRESLFEEFGDDEAWLENLLQQHDRCREVGGGLVGSYCMDEEDEEDDGL